MEYPTIPTHLASTVDAEFRGAIGGVPLISEEEARRIASDPDGFDAEIDATIDEWIAEHKLRTAAPER